MKLDLKKAAKEIAEKGMDQIKQTLKEYYNTTLEEVSLLANAKAEGRIIVLPCALGDEMQRKTRRDSRMTEQEYMRCRISESAEQQNLLRWSLWAEAKYPELCLLYHVPNEGKRSRAAGGRMKAEGLKPGVPDLCLPVARGGFHGLYIELKAQGGKPTANQKQWIEKLTAQGYLAKVCVGFESAQRLIESYLKGEIVHEV